MSIDAEAVLSEATAAYRALLGARLLAAYALGSLAHGGFSPLVSDVDLGIIVQDPVISSDNEMIQAVADAAKSKGSRFSDRLSVFWGSPATLRGESHGGRFPALDRLDLIENGRVLTGADLRADLPRPSRDELLVTGAEFALDFLAGIRHSGDNQTTQGLGSLRPADEEAIVELKRPELLVRRGVRRVTKVVLFPVRFMFTAATGHVGTNEAAVAHYLASENALSAKLVAAALSWRDSAPTDQYEAIALLRQQVIPLYAQYIDDHIERLTRLGEVELARSFEEWRHRLEDEPK